MPLVENGVEYLNASEASNELNISRQWFYENIQPLLETHRIGVRTRAYYKASDIHQLKTTVTESRLPIIVHGIQKNFVKSLQALGIPCTVANVGVPEIVPMSESLAKIFGVDTGSPIVKRGRLQGVQGTPYRLVTNWYPTKYADPALIEEMRTNDDADMPALMKAKYGVTIEPIEETVTTRKATPDERKILKIRSPGQIYEIRRINYATDGKDVVMVSDLILVARYFKLKYTYNTAHWTT